MTACLNRISIENRFLPLFHALPAVAGVVCLFGGVRLGLLCFPAGLRQPFRCRWWGLSINPKYVRAGWTSLWMNEEW